MSRLKNLAADSFQVTITNPDLSGCLATLGFVITSPPALEVDTENTQLLPPNCIDSVSGQAKVAALGGFPNYEIAWPDGKIGSIREDLAATTYTITITDNNDCRLTYPLTIPNPDSIAISVVNMESESCEGTADGQN